MDNAIRVSVRELVAFSYFEADIMPTADLSPLQRGTKAHQARQAQSVGQKEQTIRHVYTVDGLAILLFGRMDILEDGLIPLVEEIKHSTQPPHSPLPEHRAQAICYAAMLALEKPCTQVRIRVCYVDEAGQGLCAFCELLDEKALDDEMQVLFQPYVKHLKRELAHAQCRNESLRVLPFPFAQYRKGQRELAVQVYTAIERKKRLFATLPTGTGKSAAVLYPALKAMGEGKTEKVFYLTARGTARQSPLNALGRMHDAGMQARCCVLTAKEKLCPDKVRCHPDDCMRARGHYVRQGEAINELLGQPVLLWDENLIQAYAQRYNLCPFEFALALTELADVTLMDVNYVFDPFAQIKRLQSQKSRFTLLADEAHHLLERVRESLSGTMDSRELSQIRREYGKKSGRKAPLYVELGKLVQSLRQCETLAKGNVLEAVPQGLTEQVQQVLNTAIAAADAPQALIRLCLPFLYAAEHLNEDYAILLEQQGRERALTLYCLLPGKEIAKQTKHMRGAVFFSATLSPLGAMKDMLGGTEEDACFGLPSPFPNEHLAVLCRRVNTRYAYREHSVQAIARSIAELANASNGNCIAFFPSYAYLDMVRSHLDESQLPPLWVQQRDMGEKDREAFLSAFDQEHTKRLGLCVLGGLFSEGIDLPGKRLVSVAIVGVGLPVPSVKSSAVQECYQRCFGDGFFYAYRIPGMQKVLQAAGRVIRSETDRGVVMLLDERYYQQEYAALLPGEWRLTNQSAKEAFEELERCP